MTATSLRNEKLEVLPMRYETFFLFVRHVNVALVSQSNTNVQAVSDSAFVSNWAVQGNSSSITQR